jgi:hypothetical protein
MRALAPEVRLFSLFIVECDDRGDFGLGVLKSVPRRLKPRLADAFYGTAEAVPVVQRLFPQPASRSGVDSRIPAEASKDFTNSTVIPRTAPGGVSK